jgi:hypothetical protein
MKKIGKFLKGITSQEIMLTREDHIIEIGSSLTNLIHSFSTNVKGTLYLSFFNEFYSVHYSIN